MPTIEKIKAIAGLTLQLAGATGLIVADQQLLDATSLAITAVGSLVLLATERVPKRPQPRKRPPRKSGRKRA